MQRAAIVRRFHLEDTRARAHHGQPLRIAGVIAQIDELTGTHGEREVQVSQSEADRAEGLRFDRHQLTLRGCAWHNNTSPRAISSAVMPGGVPAGYSMTPETSRDRQEAQRPARQLYGIAMPAANAADNTFSPAGTFTRCPPGSI